MKTEFKDNLNKYIELIACSAKELSVASGLSPAVISRYRSGERLPSVDSEQLIKLAHGISQLAAERGISRFSSESNDSNIEAAFGDLSYDNVLAILSASLSNTDDILSRNFVDRLNLLMSLTDTRLSTLANYLNYSESHLSRICSKQRGISDIRDFASRVSEFFGEQNTITGGLSVEKWLLGGEEDKTDYVSTERVTSFLGKVDDFNLNEYIKTIKFDDLKIPNVPFYIVKTKNYYGLEEMKNAELDFLKAAVLGKSNEPVTMFNDMDMEEKGSDEDFKKKYMYGIALMLRKGLHLNVVHNLDRPFDELMMGFEGWIPMYMTGLISPYYLSGTTHTFFRQLFNVSGSAALVGESFAGHHASGKNYLTAKNDELNYYKKRAAELLEIADPLMHIYTDDNIDEFDRLISRAKSRDGSSRLCDYSVSQFKNINFSILPGQFVIISKAKAPAIHFVVRHPTLRNAIEKFVSENAEH